MSAAATTVAVEGTPSTSGAAADDADAAAPQPPPPPRPVRREQQQKPSSSSSSSSSLRLAMPIPRPIYSGTASHCGRLLVPDVCPSSSSTPSSSDKQRPRQQSPKKETQDEIEEDPEKKQQLPEERKTMKTKREEEEDEKKRKDPLAIRGANITHRSTRITGNVATVSAYVGRETHIQAEYIPIIGGECLYVDDGVILRPPIPLALHSAPPTVQIGNFVFMGKRAVCEAATVEHFVMMDEGCIIGERAVLRIGCWIKKRAVVLPHTVVPPFTIMSGNPAKVVGRLAEDVHPIMVREFICDRLRALFPPPPPPTSTPTTTTAAAATTTTTTTAASSSSS